MNRLPISLVIPTYNMSAHIDALVASIEKQGLHEALSECLIVDDGSTDDTFEKLQRHNKPWLKVIRLPENKGRYWARFEGAKAAEQPSLLFLDTRLELGPDFVSALWELHPKHKALMGVVNIDTQSSLFSLYWDRTHRWFWKKHFAAAEKGFLLTAENFDEYLKGTTVFLSPRSDFMAACELYKDQDLLSDDNALMKHIVEDSPIWVDPRLLIEWKPRETVGAFLLRLWERGPSFVEFHVFERRGGLFFWASLGLVFFVGLWFWLLLEQATFALLLLAGALMLLALSTLLFSKSVKEYLRMAPLHVSAIVTFSVAILYGLLVNLFRSNRRET